MSQAEHPLVLSELKDRILTLRLNRADKKNSLVQSMYADLAAAITEAATNPDVRVLLLAGQPGAFCAGNDLQDFLNTPPAGLDSPVIRFMLALAAFPKPVVCAIDGPAVGVGFTLLFHCELVYASRRSKFMMPFVNLGICPEYASTLLLPRMIGHVRSAEIMLLGEAITADRALELGVVNEVLDEDQVEARAYERAAKLAAQPPNALRVSKMLMKRWTEKEVQEAIPLEANHFGPMLHMPEAKEALTAMITKRKPDFSQFN